MIETLSASRARAALCVTVAAVVLAACATNEAALHRGPYTDLPADVGLHGYSPVSYFEPGVAQRGSEEFSAVYKGRRYLFVNAAQVAAFNANPGRYTPRYGEYCPFSLALGRRVGIDPTNFMIHDDRLLLFHDAIELSTVDVPRQKAVFEKADKEFTLIKF
ncbi:MAG: YHS domain-containing (seleno)protein [Pseudomonadota bacterium]